MFLAVPCVIAETSLAEQILANPPDHVFRYLVEHFQIPRNTEIRHPGGAEIQQLGVVQVRVWFRVTTTMMSSSPRSLATRRRPPRARQDGASPSSRLRPRTRSRRAAAASPSPGRRRSGCRRRRRPEVTCAEPFLVRLRPPAAGRSRRHRRSPCSSRWPTLACRRSRRRRLRAAADRVVDDAHVECGVHASRCSGDAVSETALECDRERLRHSVHRHDPGVVALLDAAIHVGRDRRRRDEPQRELGVPRHPAAGSTASRPSHQHRRNPLRRMPVSRPLLRSAGMLRTTPSSRPGASAPAPMARRSDGTTAWRSTPRHRP